jgi:sensor c-di-GMP phosphodiesterase-like protein
MPDAPGVKHASPRVARVREVKRAMRRLAVAATAACLALAPVLAGGLAQAGAASTVHFQPESIAAFDSQLAAGEIHAVTFYKTAHKMHVSMNDHSHFSVSYQPQEGEKLEAAVREKGVPIKIAKASTTAKAKAPVKHKLRYIVGGVVVVVIVAVVIVLLIGRRRALAAGDGPGTPDAAPGPD